MIDLLSEESLTAKIVDINKAIEREKLLGDNYNFDGEEYAKK